MFLPLRINVSQPGFSKHCSGGYQDSYKVHSGERELGFHKTAEWRPAPQAHMMSSLRQTFRMRSRKHGASLFQILMSFLQSTQCKASRVLDVPFGSPNKLQMVSDQNIVELHVKSSVNQAFRHLHSKQLWHLISLTANKSGSICTLEAMETWP